MCHGGLGILDPFGSSPEKQEVVSLREWLKHSSACSPAVVGGGTQTTQTKHLQKNSIIPPLVALPLFQTQP